MIQATEKNGNCYSLNDMRITINLSTLTNEQVTFLSQLGEFRDYPIWESGFEPEDFQEVMELLKNAGICEVILHLAD